MRILPGHICSVIVTKVSTNMIKMTMRIYPKRVGSREENTSDSTEKIYLLFRS